MRNFQTASYWRKCHGSCKALLLQNAFGHQIMLRKEDALPVGRFALLGVIE
jgi:hypothetical protein